MKRNILLFLCAFLATLGVCAGVFMLLKHKADKQADEAAAQPGITTTTPEPPAPVPAPEPTEIPVDEPAPAPQPEPAPAPEPAPTPGPAPEVQTEPEPAPASRRPRLPSCARSRAMPNTKQP